MKGPELDHIVEYAKVRIPCTCAPNQGRRKSTADIRRLRTDPNFRCQVANAVIATLPPIPIGTCTSDIATDTVDVMLSTAPELVPCFKRPRGVQGRCAGSGIGTKMNAE